MDFGFFVDGGDSRKVSAEVASSEVTVMIRENIPSADAVTMLRIIADDIERKSQTLTGDTPPACPVNDPFFDDDMLPTVFPFPSQQLGFYQ